MKAIILAGGEEKDKNSLLKNKAVLPLKGKPMISYVVNALKSSSYIDDLLVVGNKKTLQPIIGNKVLEILPEGSSMLDNIKCGLQYFKEEKQLLITTCDIPLINKQTLEDFIERTFKTEGDIYYPIVEKDRCISYYPDARRTYVVLKEGVFTGGNVVVLSTVVFEKIEDTLQFFIKHRKNPIKISKGLGFKIILKLLLRQLSILELENYIEKKLNIRVKAIISSNPEIASDIDRIEDIKALEKYL